MAGLVPNARSHRIEESATLAISARAARMKQSGLDVVSLGAGEPDFPTPEPIARAGIRAIEQGKTRYTAASGIPELRAAGARWLGSNFGLAYAADEVMVCAGAKGALHMALDAIVEPDDTVLILAPHWVSYPALVTMASGTPIVLPAVPEQGFVHGSSAIEAAAKKHRAKGIILNFPNNPSGACPDRSQVQAIVDTAKANDLWLVSDEIYATLLYDGATHVSPASLPGGRERTIVVNGFTKSHTLTGWRTSFLAGPRAVVEAAGRLQSQLLGNACTISQEAMLAACNTPLPDEQASRMRAFDERRQYLVREVNKIPGLHLTAPRGAFYALVDARELCKRRGIDDVALCEQLLDQHLLATVPGSAFAIPGFVRLSYAAAMDQLATAMVRLRAYAEAEVNDDENRERVVRAENLAALEVADHEWDVFAQLRDVKELLTKDQKPYLVVELADVHAVIEAKIWDNAPEAMAAARAAAKRGPVKVRGRYKERPGYPAQLIIERLKAIDPAQAPEGFDPGQLVDPALAAVEDLCCRTLVFDIETVPALDRRELPPTVGEALSSYATRKDMEPGAVMGMSPFFGKVVSLAIGEGDAEAGLDDVTVLAVPPDGMVIENCPKWLRPMSEVELLRSFWALASRAETVVSFNGRGFDVPFLVTRSLIHGIPARVDLVSQRWSLRPHLDLWELLSQRDRGPSKLDVVCWALGIESPKEVMDGSMVAPAYARGEIVKIAEYNAHDVRATSAIYRKVRDLLLRYRADWTASKQ